jgi:chromate reductase
MTVRKVGVVVGSNRKGSVNAKLARALMKLAPKQLDVRSAHRRSARIQSGSRSKPPDPAVRLKAQIQAADGIVLVTPEYNRSIPAALKNALDWASRPTVKTPGRGKPVGIAGASIGAIGTAAVQQHLRAFLDTWTCPLWASPRSTFTLPTVSSMPKGGHERRNERVPSGLHGPICCLG